MTRVYRCFECDQSFSKTGNGALGVFKSHLEKHPAYRAFFKVVLGANPNPNNELKKEE